ncbi:MAG: NAD(+)/NADH kinase [Archaeoglobaceae archaeon]
MRAAVVFKDAVVAGKVVSFLEEVGVEAREFVEPKEELEDFDFIVSVGGDGTILKILQFLRREVPIFGINTGKVGILTHATPEDFEEKLRKAIESFEVEKFPRLSCHAGGVELLALNEVAFFAREVARMLDVEVLVNDCSVARLRCDGVLVSTPIGSTGYSLSAGGPIVDPYCEVVVIAAVAPFTLSWRHMVVGMDRVIKLRGEGLAIADGQRRVECSEVVIKKSRHPAVFFKKERLAETLERVRTL